jgi:hypothetical protein
VKLAFPQYVIEVVGRGTLIGLCEDCDARIRKIMEDEKHSLEIAAMLFAGETLSIDPIYILASPEKQAEYRGKFQKCICQIMIVVGEGE